ncbi:MAG: AAA family ATPase [Fusobacterium sp.]|nr:AAA family ATPase [Fusobacterium sp.]
MSSVKDFSNKVKRYLIARIPFISINSIERARVLDIFTKLNEELHLPIYVHTLSKGIIDLSSNNLVNEDKSIVGALDFISQQISQRQNLTFILTEVTDIQDDSITARHFLDLVTLAEERGAVIIVINNNPIWKQLQRLGMSLELDLPDEDEVYTIIKKSIEPYQNSVSLEWDNTDYKKVASILTGLSKIEIQNIVATLIAKREIKKSDITEIVTIKDSMFSNISGLEKIHCSENDINVGGLNGLKCWLDNKKSLLSPEKKEILKSRNIRLPRGVLLVGVPGCGKSLLAKFIASNWQLPLYRLDFATIQGMYVGQSENRLKDALSLAETVSPCILWIDEIEKGLVGTQGIDSSGVSTRMVGQFLFWLQESLKFVFVVATANDVSKLPPELLRKGRFDELFFIDLPNETERKDILDIYCKKFLRKNFKEDVLIKLVSLTEGFSGADIESTIKEMAYKTITSTEEQLSMQTIVSNFKNVVPLSRTNPEKIEAIRQWGKERAVPASGKFSFEIDSENTGRKVLI